MKKVKILTEIDRANRDKLGTQFVRPVKLRESTVNILRTMKKNDRKMKSIDDVIVALITVATLMAEGE